MPPRTVRISSVPQPIWLQGMFATPIWNPYNPSDTGQDFSIPATADCNDGSWKVLEDSGQLDRSGRAESSQRQPGLPTRSRRLWTTTIVSAPVTTNRSNQFDVRVDHTVSSKLNLFGRYSFSKSKIFQPAPRPGLSEGAFNDTFGTADLKSQQVAAGLVWIIGSTPGFRYALRLRPGRFFPASAEFRLGMSRAN